MVEPGETWRRRKSVKVDEAQASARSCAGRPDFLPCDGVQSACTTHSHGKCFKLHWCCLLGWCHCKYVYQPMTSVLQLPSTAIPSGPADHAPSLSLSSLLAERFLRTASCLVSPTSDPRLTAGPPVAEDYAVTRINGRAFYVPLAGRRRTLRSSPTDPPENVAPRRTAAPPHGSGPGHGSDRSQREPPLQGGPPAPLQGSDPAPLGKKSRHGLERSNPEDSGRPGVDRTCEDLELDRGPAEHRSQGGGLPPPPVSGSLQELAEALETTV